MQGNMLGLRCVCISVCCCVLLCVAVCCSMLQSVAECCRVLQRVAVRYSALQCVCADRCMNTYILMDTYRRDIDTYKIQCVEHGRVQTESHNYT